jgi:outer membrane protein assembly factor BamB
MISEQRKLLEMSMTSIKGTLTIAQSPPEKEAKRRTRLRVGLADQWCERPRMNRYLHCLTLAYFAINAGYSASGSDWPEFRGPTGQGRAADAKPPQEWSPDTNIAWRTAIPGSGWSSPIVVGDRIYVTTAIQEEDATEHKTLRPDVTNNAPVGNNSTVAALSLRALAIDANTGRIVWDREVFRFGPGQYPPGHAKNSFASPTPLSDGEKIYVHFGPLGTAALDRNGDVVWRNSEIAYDARHGGAGSPILVGDKLIFNCDGVENPFVVALDRNTGKGVWRSARQPMEPERFAFSTPLAIPSQATESGVQIVSPASHMIGGYDPADGRELWHVYFDRRWSVVSRPVFEDGMVIACNGGEAPPELIAIRPDGSGNVSDTHIVWRHDSFAPLTSSVVVDDGRVYMVSDAGIASCTDAATGKLLWKKRLGGMFSASPIYADGRIYLPNDDGVCYVIAAKPTFELIEKNDLAEPILASFAVIDDALIVRTSEAMYRVEATNERR